MFRRLQRVIEDPSRLKRAILRRAPWIFQVNRRAVARRVSYRGVPGFRKTYKLPIGAPFLHRELEARELFADAPWILPVTGHGDNWLSLPLLPEARRLDRLAARIDAAKKRQIAVEALEVLLEIHTAGYAHGDFHSQNLFYHQNQLVVCDFEKLTRYPDGTRPPFAQGYDVCGDSTTLDVSGEPEAIHIHFDAETDHRKSLRETLGVTFDEIVPELHRRLKDRLRQACTTFRSLDHRHWPKAQSIYSSFQLPHFSVSPEEAQRDCGRRVAALGLDADSVSGRSILDLGCNIGGMLFELQGLHPGRRRGGEFDGDKVVLANQIAALNGLNDVEFQQVDVEQATLETLEGPYDLVICLALIEHVRDQARLYRLLGQLTRSVLFFEGNNRTSMEDARRCLLEAGFSRVDSLGYCDDDSTAGNDKRPLFRAWK